MKYLNEIGFVISLALCALILVSIPYSEEKVAGLVLEKKFSQSAPQLRQTIVSNCDQLEAAKDSYFERQLVGWLGIDHGPLVGPRKCTIGVTNTHSSRFHLRTRWAFNLQAVGPENSLLFSKDFQLETPTPLVLLPILGFLIAILFEIKFFNFAWMLASYLFLLSGANLIRMVSLVADTLPLAVNQVSVGYALIIFWLAASMSRIRTKDADAFESKPHHFWFNRIASTLTGFWNPVVFTLFGKTLLPPRAGWILPFLDFQFVVACLSLYLFSINFGDLKASLADSLLLPRYFTFGAILIYASSLWLKPVRSQRVLWKLPHAVRGFAFIVAIEVAKYFLPWLQELTTLTRIGIGLVLSELIWPKGLPMVKSLRIGIPWVGILFLGLFVSIFTIEMGVVDLSLQLLNPRMHPRILYLFTFLAGLGLSFLTGSFASGFFTLFAFMRSPQDPTLKAALLDGVVAGLLLSPISLFNLLPALQFKVGMRKLLVIRFRQLVLPLSIASLIYAIANLSAVNILQPVTFIFLVLLAIFYALRKSAFKTRRNRTLLSNQAPSNP